MKTVSSSVCSCPDCESMSCFTARSKVGIGCTCQNCKNSKTCLVLANDSLNLKASKTDAYSQIHTESNRMTDKMKLPLQSTRPKIHTWCGKALDGKSGQVGRTDAYKNNDNKKLKSLVRKDTSTIHKIQFNNLYELNHLDMQDVVDVEDNAYTDAILKAYRGERTSDVCIKDDVSLFAMNDSQCATSCISEKNALIEPYKFIIQPKNKEVICERLNEPYLPDKMFNVVNSRSVSASKSDTTKITDQIRSKLDAYDANKMNKVKSKFGTSKFVRGNAEVTKEQVQKEIVYESESDTNMDTDTACTQHDDNNQIQPILRATRSTAVSFSHSVTNKISTAGLSAQIMNVPFMDVQNSLSFDYSVDNIKKPNNLKYDLLKKIKDVYNACTCKVCQCIASVSLSPLIGKEDCNCKPCECDECRVYRSPKHPASCRLLVDDFHNCFNLNTKKGCSNSNACKSRSELCDCKPCDCLDCLKYTHYRSVSCDCKPCQCVECKRNRVKKTRTLIVAPVGEESQHRQYCQCSPCGCAECGFSYGHLSPNMTQDIGTSAYYRHTSCNCDSCINDACTQNGDICICERRSKLMQKPVRSDKNDYDIHNVIVANSNNTKKYPNNHTVAMLASYSYASKPDPDNNHCNTDYKNQNSHAKNLKDLHISNIINDCYHKENHCGMNVNWNKNKTCNCLPNKHYGRDVCISSTRFTLDCSDYKERKAYNPSTETFLNKINSSKDARVIIQKRLGCSDVNSDYSHRLLVNKNNSSTLFADKTSYLFKKSSTIENCEQHYKVFRMVPQQLNTSNLLAKNKHTPIKMDNINVLTKSSYNVSKTSTECTKCKETDSNTSVSYISAMSSFLQPELLSSAKNIELLAQVKRQVNKSSDSGNSSGHDNSDYLIQFPRCVVETCIKDILNLCTKVNMPSAKRGSSIEKYSTSKMKIKMKKKESSRKGVQSGQIYKWFNCEKCSSNSNLKSDRYKCNCKAYLSCELCINKDSSLKKTEETQTLTKGIDKDISTVHCANHSDCLDTSTEDITSRPFKFSLEDVQNQKNIFSTNNCNFPVTTSDKTKNVLFNRLYDNNNVLLTPVIDHSIENTIQGARRFSMKLLELLHRYKKANREFESITEKLKMAQDATISRNNDFNLDSYTQRFEEPEKDEVLLNEKEHSNSSVIDNRETPIKIKVYPTCYAASIHKYKRSSKMFDNNGDFLIHHDNKGNCPVSPKEFLLKDYFCANTPNLDIFLKVKSFSTYKAYRKLIKKAFRTRRRSNIRKKVPYSSDYKTNNAMESKMISTKSQTEALSGLKCGVDIEYRSFRNIEVQFESMPKEENAKYKKGNMDFKEDFGSQYIQEKASSIKFIRSPYEAKSNWTSTDLHETSTGTQVSESIVAEEWSSCGHEALLKLQKEVDDLLQMSLLSSHYLDLSLKEQNDSVHSETFIMNVEDNIDCTSIVEENNLRVPTVKNYEEHAPVLESKKVEKIDSQTSLVNGKYRSTPDVDVNNVPVMQHTASGMSADNVCVQIVNDRAASTPVVKETKQSVPVQGANQRFVKFLEYEDHQEPLVNNEDHQTQLKQKEQSSIALSSAKDWKLSYDSKKVTFPRITKFSDHTIMVKWRIPECIDGVKGYELLADGRAIEKILNPTRNMAVVTCMPHTHSDKIQVTIKTLISKLRPGAQLPSVTAVYYPRK